MSLDQSDVSAPLVVQRWRRYGHDRAYVKAGTHDLGYRDLLTGVTHCPQRADVETVERATAEMFDHATGVRRAAEYRHRHSPDATDEPKSRPAPKPAAEAKPADLRPDRDLAHNQPGEAARERARNLRDAAPIRTFFSRAVGAKTDERAWRIGADGEEDVARRLAKLGEGWRVLHAVPVGERGSDIDHVVIGPGGVFTINAKHHPDANVWVGGGTVKVNGFNQPYVRNSRHEATRAAKLLSAAAGVEIPVRGVVAVVGAQRGFTVKRQPDDVTVVNRRDVLKYLRETLPVLDETAIETIYAVARHLATWNSKTVTWHDFVPTDQSAT
ncbi:nuclease-related domain-containing protein [uncultured Jatrophihabitans sp.]|uniref:nuclease-related domain-containing protein n=1 Tax=uncultured Jatrophihabitans sp. TaxID=1610747 RepID=UPI0035CC9D42